MGKNKNEKTYSKIYTKVGDAGYSKNFNGVNIPKGHEDLELLGQIDEIQVSIDLVRHIFKREYMTGFSQNDTLEEYELIEEIQKHLWDLAGRISGMQATTLYDIKESSIIDLEEYIDSCEIDLYSFVRFGDELAIAINEARVRVRRFERTMFNRFAAPWRTAVVCKYINRLGDFLFALSYVLERNDT